VLALKQAAAEVLVGVRTVHTNKAGWLPGVGVPDDAATVEARFRDSAPGRAFRALAEGPTVGAADMKKLEASMKQTLGQGRRLVGHCWGAYSLDASDTLCPFVEFSIPHDYVNRLIYDYVNGRFYISFHYHWHEGYNPFFEVQGLPDL